MITASPAVIEFARFVFENPGARRWEIQRHLFRKIKAPYETMSWRRYSKGCNAHLFSTYFTNHLSNLLGSERSRNGKMMDWYRTVGDNGRYRYWLTVAGTRLLNATPLRDKRCFPYKDPIDYDTPYQIPTGAKMSPMVVKLDSGKEDRLTKKEEVPMRDTKSESMKPSFHDELSELSMQAGSDLINQMIRALEENPSNLIDFISSCPISAERLFGTELYKKFRSMERVIRSASDAALFAEDIEDWFV